MTTQWFEQAEQQLDKDFEQGFITESEYDNLSRDLYAEYRAEADAASQQAYDNVMRNY